jgi:probable F420-dependent oxidoreductase
VRVALFGLGIEPFVGPKLMAEAAQAAERCGFSSIYLGTHYAYFDVYESSVPHISGGDLPIPVETEMYDPFVGLTWVAAHTSTIRLGTSIALAPLLNPLEAAKQIATLDQLCGGRLVFGAGVGWSTEEYRAAGVPWERRFARMDDCISAMRSLWSPRVSTYKGEFSCFEGVYSFPKPKSGAAVPVFYGGTGDLALRRVARDGQGWMPMDLSPEDFAGRAKVLRHYAEEAGRDPDDIEITMLTTQWPSDSVDDWKRYRDAGLTELLVFGHFGPQLAGDNVVGWVEDVARLTVDRAAEV